MYARVCLMNVVALCGVSVCASMCICAFARARVCASLSCVCVCVRAARRAVYARP